MQTAQQMRPAMPAHAPIPRGRRRHLRPVQAGEAERLVAEFLSRRRVTVCPTRYAVAIEQVPQLVGRRD